MALLTWLRRLRYVDKPRWAQMREVRIDPQFGVHRPSMLPTAPSFGPFARLGTSQNPAGASKDSDGPPYPRGDREPARYAQGFPVGHAMGPVGYSPIDYGPAPQRAPKLFKDANSAWDGIGQHGYTQWNYRAQIMHLRPAQPTRGYRSVSGVLSGQGPTASRIRVPAIFVPSSVS